MHTCWISIDTDLLSSEAQDACALQLHAGTGEENIDLVESLRKSKTIQTITVRHEQAGGFMAATYGRLTGHLSHSWP